MAGLRMEFGIESEAVADAARDLAAVAEALHTRHGAHFRDLEAALQIISTEAFTPVIKQLEDGAMMILPPQHWTELLIEARRLGLI